MKSFVVSGSAVAAAFTLILACTSSRSSGRQSATVESCTYSLEYDLQAAASVGSTCASCIESHCSSQVNAYESSSGCGDYLSCICPNGTATTDQSTIESCASKESASTCATSAQALQACASSSCASPCDISGTSSGGGGSGSGGGNGTGSPGTTPLTGACATYATCCTNFYDGQYALEVDAGANPGDAGDFAATCTSGAQSFQSAGEQSECAAAIAAYADAGVSGCQ